MDVKCYQTQDYNSIQDQLLENTLGNSMGTQTAMIPKPSYKDLLKKPLLAKITAQLEVSECDGYCTCRHRKCTFTKKIVKANIVIPVEYDYYPVGKIENVDKYKWANHLPVPVPEFESGDYMFLSDRLLRKYDREYKYTIKKVEIVKNKKYIGKPKVEVRPEVQKYLISKGIMNRNFFDEYLAHNVTEQVLQKINEYWSDLEDYLGYYVFDLNDSSYGFMSSECWLLDNRNGYMPLFVNRCDINSDYARSRHGMDTGYYEEDDKAVELTLAEICGWMMYDYKDDMKSTIEKIKCASSRHTITAGQMIQALSKLPSDAKLVITEQGYYSQSEFSEMMLPEEYTVGTANKNFEPILGLPAGTKVFRIGHSEQNY